METQSNDFDEWLLGKIETFLENCEKNLAGSLKQVLEKTVFLILIFTEIS
jgi:hypothetical protein